MRFPGFALFALFSVSGVVGVFSILGIVAVEQAGAHTELLQASPGAGQRAGGEIDFLDLAFLEPVSDATVEVLHDGQLVPGSMIVSDGSIIRFEFDEALTSSGTYEVSYAMISYDLDATSGQFSFTFEPGAPQARRIGTVEPEPRNWLPIIATGVLIAALVAAAFVFLSRVEAKRRSGTSPPEAPASDEERADRP
ncbi:MAG: copper resistance CopC family protein [Acidimicrobiales bacterium]